MKTATSSETAKNEASRLRITVAPKDGGQRLDLFLSLSSQTINLSRSRVQKLIRSENVLVNNQRQKPGYLVQSDDKVSIEIPPPQPVALVPEKVFFKILYEDSDLIVISKPPGVVVHPACGHEHSTLVHGLLDHCSNLSGISGELRPGIVHRLDKDTSGVMVVALNDPTHHSLANQFKNRHVEKIYHAIIDGHPKKSKGCITLPVGRHTVNRKKMAVREQSGRAAVTHWKVLEQLATGFTYVELQLETGRTHQIRVHMASSGHPVTGDLLYGRKKQNYTSLQIKRQCLHAHVLAFTHPTTYEKLRFTAAIWPDMQNILELLRMS